MKVKVQEFAKGLDIWGIIERYIDRDVQEGLQESWAIQESTLNIEFEKVGSFVEIKYYDIESVVELRESVLETPTVKKFDMSLEDAIKMYREIKELVVMPDLVHSLHVHITNDNTLCFDVSFSPLLK